MTHDDCVEIEIAATAQREGAVARMRRRKWAPAPVDAGRRRFGGSANAGGARRGIGVTAEAEIFRPAKS
jgi:hypothetical protein